jgi:ABC-type uncharacterized transport system fused permease/ATPase subunit
MYDKELTIREPKIPWFNLILFSIIFSAFITYIVYLYNNNFINDLSNPNSLTIIVYLLWLFGILVVFILPIISRHYIHLNFSNLKIMHSYSIGVFNYNEKWQNLEDLEYISVFNTANGYEVNLWYKKNKILNLIALEDFDEVLKKAFYISEKLNIDLLDARKRGYHKWINKEIYRETGKIEYLS